MPISTNKLYRCPKCGYEKTIFQGDIIVSFQTCSKCQEMMELMGNAPSDSVDFFKRLFKT